MKKNQKSGKMTQNKLPKWFEGTKYTKGNIVTNIFSGEEYYLNRNELSIYDFIMGAQYTIDVIYEGCWSNPEVSTIQKDMIKGLDWFRKTNSRAYMVLLD